MNDFLHRDLNPVLSPRDVLSLRQQLYRETAWPPSPRHNRTSGSLVIDYIEADLQSTLDIFNYPAPLDMSPSLEDAFGQFDFDQFVDQRTDILDVRHQHSTFVRQSEGLIYSD